MIILLAAVLCSCAKNDNAYLNAVDDGYTGTVEAFAAALVGECAENAGVSAYELACLYGFEGTFIEWLVSLI